jgi:hypothetical protein
MTPSPALRLLLVCIIGFGVACAGTLRSTATAPLSDQQLGQLWVEPTDIASRDLLYGTGGRDNAPSSAEVFKVVGIDSTGNSFGYDVTDSKGREWRIKIGEEVECEVVASRLLWAIGYHQPALYFSKNWKMEGGRVEHRSVPARFRFEDNYSTDGDWSWHENPYVGTRQFRGLLVANLIVSNWDLKGTNNRIYTVPAAAGPRTWFVVQDLGAALGKTKWPTGNRNNIEGFESQNLVKRVENGIVKFDYGARHRELFADITPADVVWAAQLFARLTDKQWSDAFSAAAYPEPIATRYIAKLKSKVKEGLALQSQAGNP